MQAGAVFEGAALGGPLIALAASAQDLALQARRQCASAQIQLGERDRVVDCLAILEMSERDRSRIY